MDKYKNEEWIGDNVGDKANIMAFYRGCSKCGIELKTPEQENSHVCYSHAKPKPFYRSMAAVSIPGSLAIDETIVVYANGKRMLLKRIE